MLKRQFGCRFGEGQGVSECPLWRLDEYCRHWFIDWIWVFLPMGSRWHCSAAWHSHQGWQHPHFPIYLGPSTSDVPYSVLKNYLPSHSSMVVRIRHGRASLIQGSFLVEHSVNLWSSTWEGLIFPPAKSFFYSFPNSFSCAWDWAAREK